MNAPNQKGQAFTVYRLLIAVIIFTIVAATIYGILQYFEQIEFSISKQKLVRGLEKAVNALDIEQDIIEKDVRLQVGSYVAAGFSEKALVPDECIIFKADNSKSYSVRNNGEILDIYFDAKFDVYFKCVTKDACELKAKDKDGNPLTINMKCYISINNPPEIP